MKNFYYYPTTNRNCDNNNNNNNNNNDDDNSDSDTNNNNNNNNNNNTKINASDTLRTKQELRVLLQKHNGKKTHLRCASYSYATKNYMNKCNKIYSGLVRTN